MRRVLIIDDDRMLRREVTKALSDDFEVLEAAEPLAGIRRAQADQPDLILLDVLMPKMDGISVLRQLRGDATTSKIPVIMVTSLGSDDQVAACLEEGAIDHITKPFSHRVLCARTTAALNKLKMSEMAAEAAASGDTSPAAHRVVAFLGAKGGVGTTTLAANCGAVAASNGDSVILSELRSTFGSLSLQLNAQPCANLGTLLQAQGKLSGIDWDDYLVRDASGLRILFGPRVDECDLTLDASRAKFVIDALKPRAKLTYLDLAPGLTELNSEILKMCDRVVLVVDCEMTSIAAAKGIVDQLQQTSIRHSIKAVLVKRTPLSVPPRVDEVRSILGCDHIGTVPPGADALALAVKIGSTLVTLQPNDLVSATIRQLAEQHMFVENPVAAAVN